MDQKTIETTLALLEQQVKQNEKVLEQNEKILVSMAKIEQLLIQVRDGIDHLPLYG